MKKIGFKLFLFFGVYICLASLVIVSAVPDEKVISLESLSITSPQGDEQWKVGSVHPITWVSDEGSASYVKLEYSIDNQTTWTNITSSTSNDGTYNWTIPNTPSETCNIKISDTADGAPFNISYGTFSIINENEKPIISLNHSNLYFGALKLSSAKTETQSIIVNNSGTGILQWFPMAHVYSSDIEWLKINNISATQSDRIEVFIEPLGLAVGTYRGYVKITDDNASNSPQMVNVVLNVYAAESDNDPFGVFETPVNNSVVRSSVPVTGWALDDLGIQRVSLWRDGVANESSSSYYIGDAALTDGARPDVEQMYPTYPMNYKAGWGYMLLTNMLPNGGNGTFKIHAYAEDPAGNEVYLGSKTIICDNANAVKPFGAIDTPAQGEDAISLNYRNQGWVLTPLPNKIPEDGSTIKVYVDGQMIGTTTYNIFRLDVSLLFPGYANSSGALAYLDFDTTIYESGLHTIQWTATDNAGNTDGIGSRYFVTIQNNGYSGPQELQFNPKDLKHSSKGNHSGYHTDHLKNIPIDYFSSIQFRTGYSSGNKFRDIFPNDKGEIHLSLPQDQRLVINLNHSYSKCCSGYLLVNRELKHLPPGSSMDQANGIFYWQPGPASLGKHSLVFISTDSNRFTLKKYVIIEIVAKFAPF